MLEWDEHKRTLNLGKHGLDFTRAELLFDGRPTVDIPAKHLGEARVLTIGILDEMVVTLVWTWRGENRRAISLRRARHEERQTYARFHG